MSFDPAQLDIALSEPAISAMNDAGAASALSAPILTPKNSRVTSTTLGSAGVWGVAAAATLKATLKAMIAAGGSNGAMADYVLGVLEGAGFDPGDAGAIATAQLFVAAGVVTQNQINLAFFDVSYSCGGVVTIQDVAAGRARLAAKRREASVVAGYNAAMIAVQGGETDNAKIQKAFDDAFGAGA